MATWTAYILFKYLSYKFRFSLLFGRILVNVRSLSVRNGSQTKPIGTEHIGSETYRDKTYRRTNLSEEKNLSADICPSYVQLSMSMSRWIRISSFHVQCRLQIYTEEGDTLSGLDQVSIRTVDIHVQVDKCAAKGIHYQVEIQKQEDTVCTVHCTG